jgi:hypothetical protein
MRESKLRIFLFSIQKFLVGKGGDHAAHIFEYFSCFPEVGVFLDF